MCSSPYLGLQQLTCHFGGDVNIPSSPCLQHYFLNRRIRQLRLHSTNGLCQGFEGLDVGEGRSTHITHIAHPNVIFLIKHITHLHGNVTGHIDLGFFSGRTQMRSAHEVGVVDQGFEMFFGRLTSEDIQGGTGDFAGFKASE